MVAFSRDASGCIAGHWALRKGMGEDAVAHCRGYALEAERRMGQLLAASVRAKGTAGLGRPNLGCTPGVQPKTDPTLTALGLTKKASPKPSE